MISINSTGAMLYCSSVHTDPLWRFAGRGELFSSRYVSSALTRVWCTHGAPGGRMVLPTATTHMGVVDTCIQHYSTCGMVFQAALSATGLP